ncbi:hypothetical protein KRX54_02190 [Actinomycetaceae bacterium TAE3-ERU4]|nr:hypothetical protein [Actinomycetaceae bacterium TAE3-ERU4]
MDEQAGSVSSAPDGPAPTDEQLERLLEQTRHQLRHGTQLARSIRATSESLFAPLRPHIPHEGGGYESEWVLSAQAHSLSPEVESLAQPVSSSPVPEVAHVLDPEEAAAPADHLPTAGQVILILAQIPQASWALDAGERLVSRTELSGVKAKLLLGGPKTVLPGEGTRLRSAADYLNFREEDPQTALILVVIDSPVDAHSRVANKLLEVAHPDAIWGVWDARRPYGECIDWIASRPYGLGIDAMALHHVWESRNIAEFKRLPVCVSWLDGAPASQTVWDLLQEDRVSSSNVEVSGT